MHPVTTDLQTFADRLKRLGIDPRDVEVSLPVEDWRALDRALAEEHGLLEGVSVEGQINVGGVKYLVRSLPQQKAR